MINYNDSDRWEKVDWLKSCQFPRCGVDNKTCNSLAGVLSLLAGQLPSHQFTKVYEYVCLHWNIPKDQTELDEQNTEDTENDRTKEDQELVKES